MTIVKPDAPDILSADHDRDPYASYRVLREHYPVHFDEGTGTWLVTRYEDCVALLKSKEATTESYAHQIEPVHGRTMITMDGKEHSTHRSLITPVFHRDGLRSFVPAIEETAQHLIDPLIERETAAVRAGERERGQADLVTDFIRQFPASVMEKVLDLPADHHHDFVRWYRAIADFIGNMGGDEGPRERGLRARQELTDYFLPLIQERRNGTGQDLITKMCHASFEGEAFTDEEIRAFVSLMITAGGETTDSGLGAMMVLLLQHPEQLRAVYEDRSLVVAAFAETLRHSTSVHVAGRQAAVDIELPGGTIPAGGVITCFVAAANRDPERFADPDAFDIFRSDNDVERAFSANADHLAFGAGRHFCVGAMLARSEVERATNLILDRMGDLQMAPGFTPQASGLFFRGYDRLDVTFVPR